MSPTTLSTSRLHLTFLIRSFGFPEGMAATNRVRLLGGRLSTRSRGRGPVPRVSERPARYGRPGHRCRRRHPVPLHDRHTPARYRFLIRRGSRSRGSSPGWRSSHACAGAAVWTARPGRRRGGNPGAPERPCSYVGPPPRRAVITELNEVPGTHDWLPSRLAPALSQLYGIDGVLVISEWLREWAAREAVHLRRPIRLLGLPIVVDTDEVTAGERRVEPPMFVYAASTEYLHELTFVIRALRIVLRRYPEARLTVTGMSRARAEQFFPSPVSATTSPRAGWSSPDMWTARAARPVPQGDVAAYPSARRSAFEGALPDEARGVPRRRGARRDLSGRARWSGSSRTATRFRGRP